MENKLVIDDFVGILPFTSTDEVMISKSTPDQIDFKIGKKLIKMGLVGNFSKIKNIIKVSGGYILECGGKYYDKRGELPNSLLKEHNII
jgi:hypothetical protein